MAASLLANIEMAAMTLKTHEQNGCHDLLRAKIFNGTLLVLTMLRLGSIIHIHFILKTKQPQLLVMSKEHFIMIAIGICELQLDESIIPTDMLPYL